MLFGAKLAGASALAASVAVAASGVAGATSPWGGLSEAGALDSAAHALAVSLAQGANYVSVDPKLAFKDPVVEYGMGTGSVASILASGQFPAPSSSQTVYGLGSATAANGTVWVVTVFSAGAIAIAPDPAPVVPKPVVTTTVPAPVVTPTTVLAPARVVTHVVKHPAVVHHTTPTVPRAVNPGTQGGRTTPTSKGDPWLLYAAMGAGAYGLWLVARRRKDDSSTAATVTSSTSSTSSATVTP